jgi:hypothetical protein
MLMYSQLQAAMVDCAMQLSAELRMPSSSHRWHTTVLE